MRYPLFISLLLLFLTDSLWAQLQLTPLPRKREERKETLNRTENTPLSLPFWDDFSRSGPSPDPAKWQDGTQVWVNDGAAVEPPTYKVATFDGVDGDGKPYSLDPLTDGPTDRLVSAPIDLSGLLVENEVYMSFYYQGRGNGEVPNLNDSLRLEFLNETGVWEKAWAITGQDASFETFVLVIVPLDRQGWLHGNFQFRFQSFGRQSGPYDNWHLDYVYLNKEVADLNFPDRALQGRPAQLFQEYTSVPIEHFKVAFNQYLGIPTGSAYNLYDKLQPSNFSMVAELENINKDLSVEVLRDTLAKEEISSFPDPLSTGIRQIDLTAARALDIAKVTADSLVKIRLKLYMNTDDNQAPDYDPLVYDPLDFRVNDTTFAYYEIHDYYAYDDGSAEYGAGLNYRGNMVSVRHPMYHGESDTLVSVYIHMPNIGNSTGNLVDLIVLNEVDGRPGLILYDEPLVLKRAEALNEFTEYKLSRPVVVKDVFYLGWRQATDGNLDIGLDKNNDSGGNIYFNITGTWQQNSSVSGSLMIRPRFGSGDIITGTSLQEAMTVTLYPNPAIGLVRTNLPIEAPVLYDLSGRHVPLRFMASAEGTEFDVSGLSAGMYLLRGLYDGRRVSLRLVIADF